MYWERRRAGKAAASAGTGRAGRGQKNIKTGPDPFRQDLTPFLPLLEGKLFSPPRASAQLLGVLDRLSTEDSGRLFDWNGQRLPF